MIYVILTSVIFRMGPGIANFPCFFAPPPGTFDPLICAHPEEFAIFSKKMVMSGGWLGGDGHYWKIHEHEL